MVNHGYEPWFNQFLLWLNHGLLPWLNHGLLPWLNDGLFSLGTAILAPIISETEIEYRSAFWQTLRYHPSEHLPCVWISMKS